MQLDSRTKQISFPAPLQLERRNHPNPPACTPEPLAASVSTPHYYPSVTHGRGSVLRSSLDTPLSYYAANRARIRMGMVSDLSGLDSCTATPVRRQAQSIQIPLSALSPPDAKPGAVGGSFNSTTKVKMVPLPTIYSRHQYTYKGVRNVCLHTGRYTPSARNQPRTISHSLLNISTMQRKHLNHCETGVQKSKSLKKASEVVPHRIERAFYMNGESTQLFDRQDIPPEEVQALRTLALAQNTDLYFGKGISSRRAKRANRTIQDFETKLRLASEQSKDYGLEEMGIDAGRFSRASRTVTPGSPISEEPAQLNHLEKKRSSQRTFITQSQSKQQQ